MRAVETSPTAVLVCQGRAVADGRIATGRFGDPVAYALLRPEERAVVDRVRSGQPPPGWGPRLEYELVRGAAPMMAARTVAIDDAIRGRPAPQLVVLGAGLDSRAWRMPELAATTVYEVDRAAPQRDKRERLAGRAPLAAQVVWVEIMDDFADLAGALSAAGYDRRRPAVWVWEGVVPYLTEATVRATLGQIRECAAAGSRLVVNYQLRSGLARVTRLLVRGAYHAAARRSPWSSEPWRSTWSIPQMAAALFSHGFGVRYDVAVLDVAGELGISTTRRPDYGRVVVADV